jgi:hypothetical protein
MKSKGTKPDSHLAPEFALDLGLNYTCGASESEALPYIRMDAMHSLGAQSNEGEWAFPCLLNPSRLVFRFSQFSTVASLRQRRNLDFSELLKIK